MTSLPKPTIALVFKRGQVHSGSATSPLFASPPDSFLHLEGLEEFWDSWCILGKMEEPWRTVSKMLVTQFLNYGVGQELPGRCFVQKAQVTTITALPNNPSPNTLLIKYWKALSFGLPLYLTVREHGLHKQYTPSLSHFLKPHYLFAFRKKQLIGSIL